jgi:beta-glucanase (GH16 family)
MKKLNLINFERNDLKRWIIMLFLLIIFTSVKTIAQTLVWSDEFNYTGLPDNTKWGYDVMVPKTVNNELQYYSENRLENARVENGSLVIEARKDNYLGYTYSSARLVTRGKGDWLYGRVEVRAKLPAGAGSWPAIWMLPTDWVYGAWPNSGEVDIMEHVGKDPGKIHASTHSLTYYWKTNTQKTAIIDVPDFSTAFHNYTMEWSPSKIDIYVDNTLYFTSYNENNTWREWPFDQRMHLILNIAVGGDWGGPRINTRSMPWQMFVDYVRVYSYNAPADTQAPTVPSLLTAQAGSSNIKLSWEASRDNYAVKQYDVYNGSTLVASTLFPNYTVTGLTPQTSYTFKVRAVDYAGNASAFSPNFTTATTAVVVVNIPAKIEAEKFDLAEGVQTETTTDTGGGLDVGWIDAGDYMEYVVGVGTAGKFTISYRVAAMTTGGQVQVINSSGTVLNTTNLPATGGWQTWATATTTSFNLPQGTNRLRIYASAGGWNLNWLQFATSAARASVAETEIESVNSESSAVLSASPNPASNTVNVVINSKRDQAGKIYFRSITSSVAYQQDVNLKQGRNEFQINVSHLSSGLHLLNVTGQDGLKSKAIKLLISR